MRDYLPEHWRFTRQNREGRDVERKLVAHSSARARGRAAHLQRRAGPVNTLTQAHRAHRQRAAARRVLELVRRAEYQGRIRVPRRLRPAWRQAEPRELVMACRGGHAGADRSAGKRGRFRRELPERLRRAEPLALPQARVPHAATRTYAWPDDACRPLRVQRWKRRAANGRNTRDVAA